MTVRSPRQGEMAVQGSLVLHRHKAPERGEGPKYAVKSGGRGLGAEIKQGENEGGKEKPIDC